MTAMNDMRGLWMILPVILAITFGVVLAVVIVLLIRALLKYLRSDGRQSPPEQSRSLGEALKARRTAASYTQEYVAETLGVSRQAVSKWENGTSEPSTANLMALARMYQVTVDELLGG